MNCIFCEIVQGVRRAQVIHRDRDTLCFLDRYPVSEGHTLIIPRRHVASFLQLDRTEVAGLMASAHRVSRAVVKAYDLEGFNLILNDGPVAGQGVPHVHIHLIPRAAGDGISTPHGRHPMPESQMEEVKDRILGFI